VGSKHEGWYSLAIWILIPVKGTEIQIGSLAEIGAEHWSKAMQPNGDGGHVLAC
jgi:hypothetical protein